jgi:lipid-binding SYLF domain-containing protein
MTEPLSRRDACLVGLGSALAWTAWSNDAHAAASAAKIDSEATAALQQLYSQSDKARELGRKALAILIFPKITKAGFMVGGQGGNGVLRQGGKTAGYYSLYAGSFGLQVGAQKFSYALFFISRSALDYLRKSDGWAIGSGPSVVVIDEGKARTMNTTTLSQDVYAMPFGQKGLMAGLGLEGSKITPIHPGP